MSYTPQIVTQYTYQRPLQKRSTTGIYRNYIFQDMQKKLLNSVKIIIFRKILIKILFFKIFSLKNKFFQKFHNIRHKKVEKGTFLRFLKFSTVFNIGPFQNAIFGRTTRFQNFKVP